jgi:hypothetical protein
MCRLVFLNIFVTFRTNGLEYVNGVHILCCCKLVVFCCEFFKFCVVLFRL